MTGARTLLLPLLVATGCGGDYLAGVDVSALPTPGCSDGDARWQALYDAGLPGSMAEMRDAQLAEPCPTDAELAPIARDLRLMFDDDPTRAEPRYCGSVDNPGMTQLQFSTYRTLIAMRTLRFTRPLPWTTKPSLYDWFTTHVQGIRFRNLDHLAGNVGGYCCDGSRDGARTVVIASGPRTGLYAPPFWNAHLLGRLVHEGRHAEDIDHFCGERTDEGMWTKDRRRQDLGAFGVHYYVLWWIGEYGIDVPLYRRLQGYAGADLVLRGGFCEEGCAAAATSPFEEPRAFECGGLMSLAIRQQPYFR